LKQINALDLIPVRICRHEEKNGKIVVYVPKFKNKWMHNLFPFTRNMFFNVRLDHMGTTVWKNMCGEKSINELSGVMLNKSEENMQSKDEFRQRLSKFIMMLYERECISFRQLSDN